MSHVVLNCVFQQMHGDAAATLVADPGSIGDGGANVITSYTCTCANILPPLLLTHFPDTLPTSFLFSPVLVSSGLFIAH